MKSNEADTEADMIVVPMYLDEGLASKKRKQFGRVVYFSFYSQDAKFTWSRSLDEGALSVSLRIARDAEGVDTNLTEVEQLRNQVATLTKVNNQLKTINDELYQVAVEQFSKQNQKLQQ